jgi:hypothetical protein
MTRLTVGETSLTVGQIAKLVREPVEKPKAVVDRLRSWTKEGLIKPLGRKRPGRGRKRLYSNRALLDAAILSRLAKYYGLWAPRVLRLFDSALDLAFKELVKAQYVPEHQDVYLFVGTMIEGQRKKPSKPWEVKSAIAYVNSVTRSRPINADPPPKRDHPPFAFMDDGLFINLTRLFERLGVPLEKAAATEDFYKRFPEARRIGRG